MIPKVNKLLGSVVVEHEHVSSNVSLTVELEKSKDLRRYSYSSSGNRKCPSNLLSHLRSWNLLMLNIFRLIRSIILDWLFEFAVTTAVLQQGQEKERKVDFN